MATRRQGWAVGLLGLAALAGAGAVRAEGSNTVQVGGGNYGRTTSVGDNRTTPNPLAGIQQQISNLQQSAQPQGGGESGGGGGSTPFNGFAIDAPPVPIPTFKDKVEEAKANLPRNDREALARLLHDGDAATQTAILSLENSGQLKLKESELVRVLENARQPELARAAVVLLGKRRTPEAYMALEKHLGDRGPADGLAAKILWSAGNGVGKATFMERASAASSRDETSLVCIRALALLPGDDVTALLRRLVEDWSPEVSAAAQKARELRKDAGLKIDLPIKPLPSGRPLKDRLESYNAKDHVWGVPDAGSKAPAGDGGKGGKGS